MPNIHTGFSAPASTAASTMVLNSFKGVDMTSGVDTVAKSRSPYAPNMIPDANGFPTKRPGYSRVWAYEGKIHGAHRLKLMDNGKEYVLSVIHAGTKLYRTDTGAVICSTMADRTSWATQLEGKLWLLDGKEYKYLSGKIVNNAWADVTVGAVSSIATVPQIIVAKDPKEEGEGSTYDPFNLLASRVSEGFADMTGGVQDYYLNYTTETETKLTSTSMADLKITIKKNGTETTYTGSEAAARGTLTPAEGKVHFNTAPITTTDVSGGAVVTGEDSVIIEYGLDNSKGLAKVNACRFGILYGVSGQLDRIIMSGNPDEPNVDRWTDYGKKIDPTYVGDTYYGCIGSEESPIMGYSVLNNYLVTHKNGEENDRNAFVRFGETNEDGYAAYRTTNIIQGEGSISPWCNQTLNSEPVFLSRRGIFAMTAADITGDRYMQNRSYYINGALKDANLDGATACLWKQYYVLATGSNEVYLVDTSQKEYEPRASTSSYQYECYYWPDIDCSYVWCWDDRLYFGMSDGTVVRLNETLNSAGDIDFNAFHDWTDYLRNADKSLKYFKLAPEKSLTNISTEDGLESREWDGTDYFLLDENGNLVETTQAAGGKPFPNRKAIAACWRTPLMQLGDYGREKNILDVWIDTQSFIPVTTGEVSYGTELEKPVAVCTYYRKLFDFRDIDFDYFSFLTRDAPFSARTGRSMFGVTMVEVNVENNELDKQFGIYAIQVDYKTGNRTHLLTR